MLTIDVSEVFALGAEMVAYAESVESRTEMVVARTAFAVVGTAKVLAPVEFGTLRESIGADVDGLSAVVGPTVEYGLYQEVGTHEMSPQPYLGPAFDRHVDPMVDAIGQIGERILR